MSDSNDNKDPKNKYIALGIIFGAGIGIASGQILFDEPGMGVAMGVGIGIILGSAYGASANKGNDSDQ